MSTRFFVVGPQKTGTTWLYECLREHPDVFLPRKVKETFFFDRYYERGPGWYANYFEGAENFGAIGEIAPTYFGDANTGARILANFPGARIVAVLRNPVERAWSGYIHLWRYGQTDKPFCEAAGEFREILADGLYAMHLNRWKREFGERVSAVLYDDILADPKAAFAGICKVLGIDPEFSPSQIHERVYESDAPRFRSLTNLMTGVAGFFHRHGLHWIVGAAKAAGLGALAYKKGARPPMSLDTATRAYLTEYYARDVGELSAMLGRDLTAVWLGGEKQ